MKIGFQELVLVFIVALFAVGPDKMPEYAQKLGKLIAQFRGYAAEATKEIRENLTEPLAEAQKPLREAMEPVTQLNREMQNSAQELRGAFKGLGTPVKTKTASGGKGQEDSQLQRHNMTGEMEDENWNNRVDGNPGDCDGFVRTDTDSEADQDIWEKREELPEGYGG